MAISLLRNSLWGELQVEVQEALKQLDVHRPELLRAAFSGKPNECAEFIGQLIPEVECTQEGAKLEKRWLVCVRLAEAAVRHGAASVSMVALAQFERKRKHRTWSK